MSLENIHSRAADLRDGVFAQDAPSSRASRAQRNQPRFCFVPGSYTGRGDTPQTQSGSPTGLPPETQGVQLMNNKLTSTISALAMSGLLIVGGAGVAQAAPIQTPETTTAVSYDNTQDENVPTGDGIAWQSEITFDGHGDQVQEVMLDNGVYATLTFEDESNTFTVDASNGESYILDLDALEERVNPTDSDTIESAPAAGSARIKAPNSCQVATGIAGIAHSALWGAAVGGAVGAGAGAAVGAGYAAFWWLVGTQC